MYELKYKTRLMSSPQGKPRVYFCCHPDDFNNYFEEISEEILSKQNCSIWYDTTSTEIHSALAEDLNLMQLFAIPITYRFLTEENRGFKELEFAKENHIPILPLLQDINLVELFNQRCGNLQYLDKYTVDPTAISYDSKFSQFLEDTLVKNELADRIRKEFDAYIFLSYRKKDRKYAQKLMSLIHEHEPLRSVAIWYDEFLTIGEDFKSNIEFAVRNCDVCTLVVTPNLIKDNNYIITDEYPLIQRHSLPILPLQFEEIPVEELKQFPNLPPIINPDDEIKLLSSVYAALKDDLIERSSHTAEHDFLMGMAYLCGIDIEVNKTKGLSSIMLAANKGYPDAIKKISDMYYLGDVVERDIEQAIWWKKELSKYYLESYQQNNSSDAAKIYLKALQDIEGCYIKQKDYKKALEIMLQAEEFIHSLSNELKTGDLLAEIACIHGSLGLRYRATNQLDKALLQFEICLKMENLLFEYKKETFICNLKALCYGEMCTIYHQQNKKNEASSCKLMQIHAAERLVEIDPISDHQNTLAKAYLDFAHINNNSDNKKIAKEYFQKALYSYDFCADNLHIKSYKIEALYYLFSQSLQESNMVEATACCAKMESIYNSCRSECEVIALSSDASKSDKMTILHFMSEMYRKLIDNCVNHKSEKLIYRQKQKSVLYPLYLYTKKESHFAVLLVGNLILGTLYSDNSEYEKAISAYLDNIKLLQLPNPLKQKDMYDCLYRSNLRLANIYRTIKNPHKAIEHYQQVLGILILMYKKEVPSIFPYEELLYEITKIRICIGDEYDDLSMLEKAEPYFLTAEKYLTSPNIPKVARNELKITYNRLYGIYSKMEQHEKSQKYKYKWLTLKEDLENKS